MKTRLYVYVPLCVAFMFCLILLPSAVPNADAGEATDQIRETADAVINILNDKELKKPENKQLRSKKIRQIVDKRFDFEEMAKRSLGLAWHKRTPEEKKEFVSLFSDLIENTYIRKVERYEHEKVLYTGERVEGSYAAVKTTVITDKEVEIPVEYRIFKKGTKWEVYDVIIEGVSLVNNYRTQFSSIISSDSYAGLVKKLRDKVKKETQ
jgi:phospholipid transport system substrate-binding protein